MLCHTFAVGKRGRWAMLIAAFVLIGTSYDASAASLTLKDALSKAFAADFAVPATVARVRAAEAAVYQAGRLPNPSIGVEVENFAGTGPYRGFRSPETTLYLQQTVELGGSRFRVGYWKGRHWENRRPLGRARQRKTHVRSWRYTRQS
jgi:hypothetical protein